MRVLRNILALLDVSLTLTLSKYTYIGLGIGSGRFGFGPKPQIRSNPRVREQDPNIPLLTFGFFGFGFFGLPGSSVRFNGLTSQSNMIFLDQIDLFLKYFAHYFPFLVQIYFFSSIHWHIFCPRPIHFLYKSGQ